MTQFPVDEKVWKIQYIQPEDETNEIMCFRCLNGNFESSKKIFHNRFGSHRSLLNTTLNSQAHMHRMFPQNAENRMGIFQVLLTDGSPNREQSAQCGVPDTRMSNHLGTRSAMSSCSKRAAPPVIGLNDESKSTTSNEPEIRSGKLRVCGSTLVFESGRKRRGNVFNDIKNNCQVL
jgi:hypothetical protein